MSSSKPRIESISAYLPPCEDIVVGHSLFVKAFRLCEKRNGQFPNPHWPATRHTLLRRHIQEEQFTNIGIWCFLVNFHPRTHPGEIWRELSSYFVDGLFLRGENKHSSARLGRAVISQLIKNNNPATAFLANESVWSFHNRWRGNLRIFAGPAPLNYNPQRPTLCEDPLELPPSMVNILKVYPLSQQFDGKLPSII